MDNCFKGIINQQDCIFHKLQNIGNAVRDKTLKLQSLNDASRVYKSKDQESYEIRRSEFIERYKNIEPMSVRIFSSDNLIKSKFEISKELHHLVNTTMPLDRAFRKVRRRTNVIGCFESVKSLDKFLFFTFSLINHLLGNASFETTFNFTQN